MNETEFKTLIAKYSDDNLSKVDGMVYQVWEDGEITLQKCGPILWQRNLHCIHPGSEIKTVDINLFPHIYNNHGYVFCSEEGAQAIRAAIFRGVK